MIQLREPILNQLQIPPQQLFKTIMLLCQCIRIELANLRNCIQFKKKLRRKRRKDLKKIVVLQNRNKTLKRNNQRNLKFSQHSKSKSKN
jgi:hypothetical protein